MSDLQDLTREDLIRVIVSLQERVAALEEEIRQLRGRSSGGGSGSGSSVPSFVKPNRSEGDKEEKPARKKRSHPAFRGRDLPTEEQSHAAEVCPDCGRSLSGGWEVRRRQVIELPVTPVRIVDHVVIGRHCGVCGKNVIAPLDLSEEVVGQHRVGVRLMSLIALWREVGRLPIGVMQRLLEAQYGLHLSSGELVQILHTVAARGQACYADLQAAVRRAPFVHADETGWREDGKNGYVWSFSTPSERYFTYSPSRAGAVAEGVLSAEPSSLEEVTDAPADKTVSSHAFRGVLVSDFYSGYCWYPGEHQRCWVHLLRDLHDLKEKHPSEPSVMEWVKAIRAVYDAAQIWVAEHPQERVSVRRRQRFTYQRQLETLGQVYAGVQGVAQRVLAERLMRFTPELFTFVEYPGVPSENNAAERAVRPSVIARKISGGTRSPKGSATRAILRSLFATWQLQGRDLMQTCQQMLCATFVFNTS
jgi:transposase